MKKILLITVVVISALIGAAAFALNNNTPKENTASVQSKTQESTNQPSQLQTGLRYVEYSKAALENSANTRRVFYFYANWCPTCRPADKNFQENSEKIPEDVTLIRVNYNDDETDEAEKELAKKYQITYQHTFVQIDAEGTPVTKWNGGQIDELLENIK